ncbi:MAG TPA: NAD(P)/FAD-dependent oxidoreductase [Solirubrobacterales bacterium]|nr:NAD(P)/FAD-dependent oxidoreductase [Solirubrobacterales bacterium]
MNSEWDCVIVGGGAAGLSGALVLGRARRRALLLDVGGQSNRVAEGIGGLLGNDRRPPAEFYAAGREEIVGYGSVELRDVAAVGGERRDEGFALALADGTELTTATVLLAAGMDYRYRELPGASERWGRSVFHCPFCHGWEVRGRDLAVLGSDEGAVHRVLLLTSWSDSVALLTDGGELPDGAAARLAAAGVEVDDRKVASLEGPGSDLRAAVFDDGWERPLGGLLVAVSLTARSELPYVLGATRAPATPLTADGIEVDPTMNAGVRGLYAAGDLLPKAPSVPAAIHSGHFAAAAIVGALTAQ